MLEASTRGEIRVVVPSVVVDEVVNAAEGSFTNARRQIRGANDILNRHGQEGAAAPEPDVRALTTSFRSSFEQKLLDHQVEIVDVATTSVQLLIDRDLAHRKPFMESGKGMRDALIWEAILRVDADEDIGSIIFVTRNTRDFADADDAARLHSELAEELVAADRVALVSDLGELFRRVGTLRTDLAETIIASIEAESDRLAWAVLAHVAVPLPAGIDAEVVSARLGSITTQDAYYTWGAASAVVNGELEYLFSAVADEADVGWVMNDWQHHMQVDEWMEDSTLQP